MIALDTSALMAVILDEATCGRCIDALAAEPRVSISAGTVAEASIVAAHRNVAKEMAGLIDGLGFEVMPVTAAAARRIALAYSRWGKGVHPAGLNSGDCFSYEVAQEHGCALLFAGADFALTDLESVLADPRP